MNNWKIITTMAEMAEFDGEYVAYIDQFGPHDLANLSGCIGHCSCNKDKTYCSIIEDGEIIYLHDINQMIIIPTPIGLSI